jgi:Flp pilus assembly CpaF family ATPase
VLFLRRYAIVGGATGSGKSGGLNELLANLAAWCVTGAHG